MMKSKWITLSVNGLFVALLFLLLNEGSGYVKWMNALFYITILNMIIVLYMFITKGRFFDGFIASFQRLSKHNEQQKLPSETISVRAFQVVKFNFFILGGTLLFLQLLYSIF